MGPGLSHGLCAYTWDLLTTARMGRPIAVRLPVSKIAGGETSSHMGLLCRCQHRNTAGCERRAGGWHVWWMPWGGARTPAGRVTFTQGRLASCGTRLVPLKFVCSSEPVSRWPPPVSVGGSLDKSQVSSRVPCMSGDPHGESLPCCFSFTASLGLGAAAGVNLDLAGVTPFHLLHFVERSQADRFIC